MKIKFPVLSLVLSGCHFLISTTIVPFTLWMGNVDLPPTVKETILELLHFGTKVFYFPILGFALYPRHWFPGPWIYVPILLNSLLWGILIACSVLFVRSQFDGNTIKTGEHP